MLNELRPEAGTSLIVFGVGAVGSTVQDREAAAGLVTGDDPVLYVAGANGAVLAQKLGTIFTALADEHGRTLTVEEVTTSGNGNRTSSGRCTSPAAVRSRSVTRLWSSSTVTGASSCGPRPTTMVTTR